VAALNNAKQKHVKKVAVRWNTQSNGTLFTLTNEFNVEDLLTAWTRKDRFISHYSAMYFNELTEQMPVQHYISREVKGRKSVIKTAISKEKMKQSFMKSPRETTLYCRFEKSVFYFLLHNDTKRLGITNKKITRNGKTNVIQLTDVERTLIDISIAPHHSGGISNIVSAFRNARIDLKKLKNYYLSMELTYPYFQRIGFFLEKAGKSDLARKWQSMMPEPELEFFLDKNYTRSWKFDESWKLFHPGAL